MIKVSTIEISLGAIALMVCAAGSFLIAGGQLHQLPVFVGISSVVLAIAAGIVASRVSQYRSEMRTRLFYLLPSERACEPDAATLDSLGEAELFESIEAHLKQQDAVLAANCHALMQGHAGKMDELSLAEDELRQLRSEISALEDQFRTDQSQLNGSGLNMNNGYFPPSGHNAL